MAIYQDIQITVNQGLAVPDKSLYIFRGDSNIILNFKLITPQYMLTKDKKDNLVTRFGVDNFELRLQLEKGYDRIIKGVITTDGYCRTQLTQKVIQELRVGSYSYQITLIDDDANAIMTFPVCKAKLNILDRMSLSAEELPVPEGLTGEAMVDLSLIVDNGEALEVFDSNGNYIKTNWSPGDVISSAKLNKIEDAIHTINQNEINDKNMLNNQITSKFNTMQNQIDNLVLESGGDSNLEVIQARGDFETLSDRLNDMSDSHLVNISRNLLSTPFYIGTGTNAATANDLGNGIVEVKATASWGGTYNYKIIKPAYNHVYAIMVKTKGSNCWPTAYQYSAVGVNLGAAECLDGSDEGTGTTSDFTILFSCHRVTSSEIGRLDIGVSVTRDGTAQVKDAIVMDLGEISDDAVLGLKTTFKAYGYWSHSIPNFTYPELAKKAVLAETATNAMNSDYATVAAYAESGDFADIAKIHKNEIPKLEDKYLWDNGCTHTIENDGILMKPSSTSGWGGELLYKLRPDNKTNIDISKRKYLFTALVKRHEADAKVRVRWFAYSGDFTSLITSASSSTMDVVNEEYSRITHIYEMPAGTNVFAAGLIFDNPNTAFKTKEWMCIDVTDLSKIEITSLQSLIDSEEYWTSFPKIARVATIAYSADSLTDEYEKLLINKTVAATQNAKFLDVTDKLAWTTNTREAGTSIGWWVANNSKDLDLNSTYIYIVRWDGSNKETFYKCSELRNSAWYDTTTLFNKATDSEDTRIRTWIFKTDDTVSSPILCCQTSDTTLTTDVTITAELYKILDEKYINEKFPYDIAKAYMSGNSIKSYDFSDLKKWGEDTVTNQCKWKGKNALVIGDSITAAGKWQLKLKEDLGMNVSTHAKGGVGTIAMVDGDKGLGGDYDNETNASGTLYPLNVDDVKDKDLIVVLPCYNNRGAEEGKIGDCYNPSTKENNNIAGMVQYLINRIYEELTNANNLNCKVLIATPHCAGAYNYNYIDGYGEYPTGSGRTMETLSNTIKEICNYNNIPVCDLWHNSGISKFTWTIYGSNPNAVNTQYTKYQLNDKGETVGTSPMRYVKGNSYYQIRDGKVVLEEYTGASPYPFVGDQLHCSSLGYARIGECIVGSIISAYGY